MRDFDGAGVGALSGLLRSAVRPSNRTRLSSVLVRDDSLTRRSQAFTQKFAELLSSVLYTQPSLRPSVCRGLQLLVERNRSLSRSASPPAESLRSFGLTPEDATKNVALLGKLAPNLLAVLFNVYAKAGSNARGFILECISAYLSVLSPKVRFCDWSCRVRD